MVFVHWSSALRSISFVVALAYEMIPNSSLSFLFRMLVVTGWYVRDYHIPVLLRICNAYAEERVVCF